MVLPIDGGTNTEASGITEVASACMTGTNMTGIGTARREHPCYPRPPTALSVGRVEALGAASTCCALR